MRLEEDAFLEALYREFFPKLWRYALAALRDPERAREVVQDTFHEAVRRIDVVMVHENPRGWLMETLKKKIKRAERDLNRYMLHFLSLHSDLAQEDVALAQEGPCFSGTVDLLKEIRDFLPPEDWELLREIALEKRTYLTVSRELEINVWACQKRVQRIREKLRKHFQENF